LSWSRSTSEHPFLAPPETPQQFLDSWPK
jgi:hypothetical protein